jgi:hypothetical protein
MAVKHLAEDYLGSGVPRGCVLQDHSPIEPTLRKGEDLLGMFERIQKGSNELRVKLNDLRSAPRLSAVCQAEMREHINAFAEAGKPDVSGAISAGLPIEIPSLNLQVTIHNAPGAIGFVEVPNALGLICWLHRDELIEKLTSEITARSDDKNAIGETDRQEREAEILAQMLSNDRVACALVERGAKQGIGIDYRRDCSPLALLSLTLVVPTREH